MGAAAIVEGTAKIEIDDIEKIIGSNEKGAESH